MAVVSRGYARRSCRLSTICTHKKYYCGSLSNTNSMQKCNPTSGEEEADSVIFVIGHCLREGIYGAAIKFRGLDVDNNFSDSDGHHDPKQVCDGDDHHNLKQMSSISKEEFVHIFDVLMSEK
uniref:Uncharacterized protein n=1 Tax=Solanum lycopersicum TaxID=4081 RepID=A0A3Q7HJT0_SOLLC